MGSWGVLTRRGFFLQSALGAGGLLWLGGCGVGKAGPWRFFTAEEAALTVAICEQIIPADQDPGATDAGVVHFIDRHLMGRHALAQDLYRRGLPGVDETSQAMHGAPFLNLSWEQQTQVLETLDSGKAPGETWRDLSPSEFFSTVIDHTMQGFYGSPRHGGNRDYVSYRMMGIEMPDIIGQNRYAETGAQR